MIKTCQQCKKEFTKSVNCSIKEWATRKYCSHKCGYEARDIGKKIKVCLTCNKEFSKAYGNRKYCSSKCNPSKYWLGKNRKDMVGENNRNWKGGISTEQDKLRHTNEMRLWRKLVLKRDNFTCQKTGQSGGELHIHHINNFSEFPELRSEVENGITLSKKSHNEFHKIYGKKNNTKEQLVEFLGREIRIGLTK